MVLTDKLKRSVTLTLAALLFLASLVPLLTRQKANAYELLGDRSIQMSSSAANTAPDGDGDGDGDGTNVTYLVEFDITTTGPLGGIVVTFCENSPIIGDTDCDLPAGFTLASAAVANGSDGTGATVDLDSWTAAFEAHDTLAGTVENTLTLSDATGDAGAAAGDTATFEITGVTNPTATNATFYARIYTFDTQAEADAYLLATPEVGGPAIDAGGIALSTAQQLLITSKVQERLTFCVYTQDPIGDPFDPTPGTGDNNCTAKVGNTINLGDTNGVLDSAGPFVDKSSFYGITTNASGQAAIRMKGDTLELTPTCGGVGSCQIDPIGDVAQASSDPASVQQEQFGFCTYQMTGGTGLSVTSLYDGAQAYAFNSTGDGTGDGCNSANVGHTSGSASPIFGAGGDGDATFAFDTETTNTPASINSTYGMTIASKPAGAFSTGNLVFIGNITDTTEPGIYRTTLTFVATGTY